MSKMRLHRRMHGLFNNAVIRILIMKCLKNGVFFELAHFYDEIRVDDSVHVVQNCSQ